MPTQPATHHSKGSRHPLLVRVTHWITFAAFLCLLLSGIEIVLSHPRFYWGETGNVNMAPLFSLHVPSSRATVPTGYKLLPDQNGWSRSLHFQAAWLAVLTGILYVAYSLWSGHLRRDLLPSRHHRGWRSYAAVFASYLRPPPATSHGPGYNAVQRTVYLVVILGLFPMMIWTGLAMSPSFVSAVPLSATLLGGRQSARTLHFFITGSLVLFVLVHVVMVALGGFWNRVRAMIIGIPQERP